MKAFKCLACREILNPEDVEPTAFSDSDEAWGDASTYRFMCDCCSSCGSAELEEIALCDECEERTADEGGDLCTRCYSDETAELNCGLAMDRVEGI